MRNLLIVSKKLTVFLLLVGLLIALPVQPSIALDFEQSQPSKGVSESITVSSEGFDNLNNLIRKEIDSYLKNKIELETAEIEKELSYQYQERSDWKEYSRQHFLIIKHIFDETRNSLTTIIQYSVIGVSIVFAVAAWLIRGELNNFRQVEELFRKITEDVNEKNKELLVLKEKSQSLKDEFAQEIQGIHDFKESLRQQYSEVYEFLEVEKSIKKRAIIWIFERDAQKDYGIIDDLKRDGFSNIDKWCLDTVELPLKQDYDFAIYSYMNFGGSKEKLKNVLSFMNSSQKEIPLIIFIYNEERKVTIPDEEMSMLQKYGRFSIATTPSRFKAEFKTLIRE